MNITNLKAIFAKRETYVHIAFWIFYFSSIGVTWSDNWGDKSLRPLTVSQFSIVLFPVLFYLNAFWLMPKYLKTRKWFQYIFVTAGLILSFELLRCLIHVLAFSNGQAFIAAYITEFNSYDNTIAGRLNPAILTLQFSFAHRLIWDWLHHNKIIQKLKEAKNEIHSEENKPINSFKTSFSIKKKGKVIVINTVDILYFQAQGDFVLAIHTDGQKYIINSTLTRIESEVNPVEFLKINRSEILNKSYVINYESYIKNRLKIALCSFEDPLYTSNSRTPLFRKWVA